MDEGPQHPLLRGARAVLGAPFQAVDSFMQHSAQRAREQQPVVDAQAQADALYRQQRMDEFRRTWEAVRDRGLFSLREQPVAPSHIPTE
jgi:hypothetical protein